MKKWLVLLVLALPSIPQAQSTGPVLQQVVVTGHRVRFDNPNANALVRYILIDPGNAVPARVAVLMLFIGGDGTLNLTGGNPPQVNTGSPNFLARNRSHFAAEGFVVALIDGANDFNGPSTPEGLTGHRLPDRPLGQQYLADLQAVMANLRRTYPDIPIWAVGNSRGTVSAAVTGLFVNPPADGLVLTSSLTGPHSEDLRTLPLESYGGPVLILSHEQDRCLLTKPADSEALTQRFSASEKVQFKALDGGSTPINPACESLAPHGFFGIDQKAVEAITRWIRGREDDAQSQ